ncbi:MAG: Tellurite resistance protein TerB [Thermoleophilia bacterium]|nr:Tellurite resistance protein TerB [Thermoleophilia bacterium]
MRGHLQRLIDNVRYGADADVTTVQLRLLVAMAFADDRLGDSEAEQLVHFVDRHSKGRRDYERLMALLDELAASPPRIDDVLEELVQYADRRTMGARLVHELSELAGADHAIDHREEFLLDLVCETFGFAPVAFHDEHDEAAAALHDLVARLARAA